MSLRPAEVPPFTSNQSMPPWWPFLCCASASAFCGNDARPGYRHVSTFGCASRNSAIACALDACCFTRTAIVLHVCSVVNAVCADMMLPCMFCKVEPLVELLRRGRDRAADRHVV